MIEFQEELPPGNNPALSLSLPCYKTFYNSKLNLSLLFFSRPETCLLNTSANGRRLEPFDKTAHQNVYEPRDSFQLWVYCALWAVEYMSTSGWIYMTRERRMFYPTFQHRVEDSHPSPSSLTQAGWGAVLSSTCR